MAPTTTRFNQSARITTLIDASTISINSNSTYIGVLLSLSQSSTFQTPTGNPTDGQPLQIRITSLLARTISFDTGYQASSNNTLPTITTGSGKEDYFFFIYNALDNKWNYINSSIANTSNINFAQTLAIGMLKC